VEEHRITIEPVVPTGPVRLQTEHPAAANPHWDIKGNPGE
jgi:hypothetical protein